MNIFDASLVVAGCGQMGRPMTECLIRAGFNARGFDIRPAQDFDGFATSMVTSPDSLAEADVLISVVRDAAETLALCFDQQAVFAGLSYPSVLVISSTLSPRFIAGLADRLPADVTLVDAPMSGAPHSARDAKLSFMLGGPDKLLDELEPMFRAMGSRLFRGGDTGAGMTLKVLNNYVAASSVAAVRRVYAMASVLNVDLATLRNVMAASSGATWFGDHFDAIDWSREGYDPTNTIGILEKDVRAALDAVADEPSLETDGLDSAILSALKSLKPFTD